MGALGGSGGSGGGGGGGSDFLGGLIGGINRTIGIGNKPISAQAPPIMGASQPGQHSPLLGGVNLQQLYAQLYGRPWFNSMGGDQWSGYGGMG